MSLERELAQSLGMCLELHLQTGPPIRRLGGHQRPLRAGALHGHPGRFADRADLQRLPARERPRRTALPHHESRTASRATCTRPPSTFMKRMTGRWSLNASVTYLRGTGRVQESRSGVTLQQRSGLQFRGLREEPQRLREHRRPPGARRALELQGPGHVPAPGGVPGLRELLAPRGPWIVRRATLNEATIGVPEGRLILLQQRAGSWAASPAHLPRHAPPEGLQARQDRRASRCSRDALNLMNEDAYEGVQSSTVTSSVFLWPFDPVDPRRLMLGAKLGFSGIFRLLSRGGRSAAPARETSRRRGARPARAPAGAGPGRGCTRSDAPGRCAGSPRERPPRLRREPPPAQGHAEGIPGVGIRGIERHRLTQPRRWRRPRRPGRCDSSPSADPQARRRRGARGSAFS